MLEFALVWILSGTWTWAVRGGVWWKVAILGPLFPLVCLAVLLFDFDEKHPEWRRTRNG